MRNRVFFSIICLCMCFYTLSALQNPFTQNSQKDGLKTFLDDALHNPIYFLGYYHSFSNPYDNNLRDEVKYQFSFKLPIIREVLFSNANIYFAYTQTAWFQLYNKNDSRPFRDLDYIPEFFYEMRDISLYEKLKISKISLGYIHISNGERVARSRTSNRIMLNTTFAYDKLRLQAKLWFYTSTGGDRGDFRHDNPDLQKYWGYNEILLAYKSDRQIIEASIQPLFARHYRGKFSLGYTIRVTDNIGLYAQYVHGYGDNLYEYNHKSKRIGVGVRYFDF